MTGAVPRPLTVVPLNETTEVGVDCIDGMEVAILITIDTENIVVIPGDRGLTPFDVTNVPLTEVRLSSRLQNVSRRWRSLRRTRSLMRELSREAGRKR